MSDLVVTVPKAGWQYWIEEGALPGEPWEDGEDDYHFFGGGPVPRIVPGERVYIVAWGRLRGYAPLVRLDIADALQPLPPYWWGGARWGLVRQGGAEAVTIAEPIRGFRGWRPRWWDRTQEVPFPAWQTAGIPCTVRQASAKARSAHA